MRLPDNTATLGIYTVGGAPPPIIASLKAERPDRVILVTSADTTPLVEQQILPGIEAEEFRLSPGQYEILQVSDPQDFSVCVQKMRELDQEVEKWLGRGGDHYRVNVDFTGGTKCMSAALALVGQRWPCRFLYVGGKERTKDGVGVVVSGSEYILHFQNPWNALGYQAVEDAMVLFDRRAYASASHKLEAALKAVSLPDAKREISAFKHLCDAYDSWDRFDHQRARQKLQEVRKGANDLRHLMGNAVAETLLEEVRRSLQFLDSLKPDQPGDSFIVDLLANARRRGEEGRYDDGVARLYRAIEALAQLRLNARWGIADTGKVSISKLPEQLRPQWADKAQGGAFAIGLQDCYRLLRALGDELGEQFHSLALDHQEKSPLSQRNSSILAHGFQPVSKPVFDRLFKAALGLAGIQKSDLPEFFRFSG